MWEYIVIGHAVLTIYLVISMYNTLRMGVICDPVVLLENHYENIYNHMDPDHYDEEWEPSAEEAADLQAEAEEEERKETAVEKKERK